MACDICSQYISHLRPIHHHRITHHLPEDTFGITGVLDSDVKVRELILRK